LTNSPVNGNQQRPPPRQPARNRESSSVKTTRAGNPSSRMDRKQAEPPPRLAHRSAATLTPVGCFLEQHRPAELRRRSRRLPPGPGQFVRRPSAANSGARVYAVLRVQATVRCAPWLLNEPRARRAVDRVA
jgi:hypothetical protein